MEALGILEGVPLKEMSLADRTHWMVEAIKCAFADRWRYLSDPRFVPDRTAELLNPEFLARRRDAIQLTRAQETPLPGSLRDTDTTCFCIADEEGNAISFIQSVYHPFGCGVVIEGTGILMNNRMCGFSLDAESPNRLAPRKRPMHTLNAYLITRGDALAYVGGTPGGDIQVQSNLQIISQLIDFELDPQQAIEKPRWAWQPLKSTDPSPGRLSVETLPNDSESQARIEELRKRGHVVNPIPLGAHPSAVQVIQKLGETYLAGSDPRAEGLAGGY